MTPPLIRLPHGTDAPSIPVRLTWLGDVPAIDVGEADEETMAEIRRWIKSAECWVVVLSALQEKWERAIEAMESRRDPR